MREWDLGRGLEGWRDEEKLIFDEGEFLIFIDWRREWWVCVNVGVGWSFISFVEYFRFRL